jgi:transposase
MPNECPVKGRERAIRVTLDRLKDYPSLWADVSDLAPKLNVGAETLRKWTLQAQSDAGDRVGPQAISWTKFGGSNERIAT